MAEESKVALITGSSSGIGEAAAKLLFKNGYKVVICGSNEEKVNRVVKECAKLGGQPPLGLVLDFNVAANGQLAVEKTLEHFKRLDVLVNNAGIYLRTPVEDPAHSYESYKSMMTINLDATIKCTLAAVEHLKKTRGHVIFVSSTAADMPIAHTFGYCATKAAMSMFAKCLSVDLAPHVRVNIVSPGPVQTEIMKRNGFELPAMSPEQMMQALKNYTLLERFGHVDEIAEAILFLASNKCTFIHGNELFIDGGQRFKAFNQK